NRYRVLHHSRRKRDEENGNGNQEKKSSDEDEDEWLESMVNAFTDSPTGENVDAGETPRENATEYKWIRIEYADEAHPALLLSTPEAIEGLALKISLDALQRFEKVGLYLPGICADYVPKAIDEFDSSSFQGVEIEGPIGVNITALEAAGVNLTALAEKLRNDTEVDEILSRTNAST
ncbi:hypothetical protein ANCCEY_15415, partial [Ancylostoma ceylanicum]